MTSSTIEGFHGTSKDSAAQILASSFKSSNKADEWLGFGIYFFVEGISDPAKNAQDWAKAQAFDKKTGGSKYQQYGILKSKIKLNPDRVIDLTDNEGLKFFNEIKEDIFDQIFGSFHLGVKPSEHNCRLFNFIVNYLSSEAVKHNLYIKSIRERKIRLRLNVPNTTVLCVCKENAEIESVLESEGDVK